MKAIKLLIIICTFFISANTKAQTSIELWPLIDSSTWTGYCNVAPFTTQINISGGVSGYNVDNDVVNLQVFFGDGTDTLFNKGVDSASWANIQAFYAGNIPHTYYAPGNYNVMCIATAPDGLKDTAFISYAIYGSCSVIEGYLYLDTNHNCAIDQTDIFLNQMGVDIKNSDGSIIAIGYTDQNGFYSVSVPPNQTLTVIPGISLNLEAICPTSGDTTLNVIDNSTYVANFGLELIPDTNSTVTPTPPSPIYFSSIYHTPSFVGAPGNNGVINFCVEYAVLDTMPIQVQLVLNPNVTYTGMANGPQPSSISGDTLTWNVLINSLSEFISLHSYFCYSINISTSTSATLFQWANFSCSVIPSQDYNPSNNYHNWCLLIGGPYDPNNKEVYPPAAIAPNQTLNYRINFQNTGTAPAINVNLVDTISNYLDMNTFEIVQSSHYVRPILYNTNILRFEFPNINLPDSNANEPLSHGWIEYKIKPKAGIPIGTEINNTAHIYFDYNAAIVTNTTLNTIEVIGIKEKQASSTLFIYPNPATNKITINNTNKELCQKLEIFDLHGRLILTQTPQSNEIQLPNFDAGLYFINAHFKSGIYKEKLIITK